MITLLRRSESNVLFKQAEPKLRCTLDKFASCLSFSLETKCSPCTVDDSSNGCKWTGAREHPKAESNKRRKKERGIREFCLAHSGSVRKAKWLCSQSKIAGLQQCGCKCIQPVSVPPSPLAAGAAGARQAHPRAPPS
jgi:hypothetical protein